MSLLLDTHVILWWLDDSPRRGVRAREALIHEEVAFSTASIWEISIKSALGLLRFSVSPERAVELLFDQGFASMSIHAEHALAVRNLPFHHKDPFNRMLVAQRFEKD